jgi:hypothetical protein
MRYTIKGYVKIPFSHTVEAPSLASAVSQGEARGDDLAKGAIRVLKDRASNLAGEMGGEKDVSAVITSVTS